MQTGIFILSKNITNPTPDRRYKDKWLAAVTWEKGWRFSVRRLEYREKDYRESGAEGVKVFEVKCLGNRFASGVEFVERGAGAVRCAYWREEPKVQDAMMALLGALVPSTETHDSFLWQFMKDGHEVRDYADDVLWQLYRSGHVTDADIAAAMKAHEDEVDREWEREQAEKQARADEAAQKGATS